MTKMVALRRFHYPSGPTGRDYKPGDQLEALSERDAKALQLIRSAKLATDPVPPKPSPPPEPVVTPEPEPETRSVDALSTEDLPSEVTLHRRARRKSSSSDDED